VGALFIVVPVFFTLVLVALIVIFLFDLPFGQLWPIFLIIGGLSMLLSRRAGMA